MIPHVYTIRADITRAGEIPPTYYRGYVSWYEAGTKYRQYAKGIARTTYAQAEKDAKKLLKTLMKKKNKKDTCYKCKAPAKYITHTDKDGKTMPDARFTCEKHHYSD